MSKVIYFLLLTLILPIVSVSLDLDVESLKKYSQKNPQDYRNHMLLGRYYFEHNDYNQSLYYVNLAKQINTDAPEVNKLSKELKDYSNDISILNKYNLSKNDSCNHFYKTLEELKNRDNIEDFEKLLDYLMRHKKDLQAKTFLLSSEYMLEKKEYQKSRNLLVKSAKLKKEESYLKIEAKLCEAELDFFCSAKAYEKLNLLSSNTQEQLMAAKMYLSAKDYVSASAILQNIPKSKQNFKLYQELSEKIAKHQTQELKQLKENYKNKPDLENLKRLCNNLHNAKQYKELSSYIENYSDKNQKFYQYAGDIAYWNNDIAKAIFYYSKIDKKDIEIFYKLGRLYSWKNSYKRALSYLDKAQELDNKGSYYYKIYEARAYIWLWNAQYDKAAKVFKALTNHSPDNLQLQKAYKDSIAHRDGRYQPKKNVKQRPQYQINPDLRRALFYYERNRYLESLDYFRAYFRKSKNDILAKEKYAFALEKSKYYKESAQEYQELYKSKNSDVYLHHVAYNLYNIKEYDKAKKVYEKIIFSQGNNKLSQLNIKGLDKGILREYGFLLEESNRVNEARELYESMLHQYRAKREITKSEKEFLSSWLKSWKNRSLKTYASYYKNSTAKWKQQKEILFKNSGDIDIDIIAPRVISADIYEPYKTYTISFLQEYKSNILQDRGFKELDLTCNKIGCLIEDERWKKFDINASKNSLKKHAYKRLKYLRTAPLKSAPLIKKVTKESKLAPSVKTDKIDPKIKEDYIAKSLHVSTKKEAKKVKIDNKTAPKNARNIGIKARSFSDNDKRHYTGAMLYGGYNLSKETAINGGIGAFSLKEDHAGIDDKISGTNLMLELVHNSWTFGTFLEFYLSKTDIAPYIIYNTYLKNNFINYLSLTQYLQFKIYKRNLYVSKLSTGALREEIDKYALNLSDYMEFNRFSSLWFAIDLAYISDDNNIFNFMFDYEMYKNHYKKLKYSFILSGWYEYNKETKPQYYSPNFDDVTELLTRLYYPLSDKLNLKVQGGFGRSTKYEKNILKYGLWLETPLKTDTKFNLGCLRSQVLNTPIVVDTLGYDYIDCKLELQHFW